MKDIFYHYCRCLYKNKIFIVITMILILKGVDLYAESWNYLMKYSGYIDNKYEVLMFLDNTGNKINGKYMYMNQKEFIDLTGEIVNGRITMKEFDKNLETGKFTGTFTDQYIKGVWESHDKKKKLPFLLEKDRTVGGLKIDLNKTDLNKFIIVYDDLVYTIGEYKFNAAYFEIPEIYGNFANVSKITKIKEMFNDEINSIGDEYPPGIIYYEKLKDNEDYNFYNIKIKFGGPYFVFEKNIVYVYLSDNNIISYTVDSNTEDGAHINFWTSRHTLDIDSGKPINLDVIFKGNYKEVLIDKISKYITDNGYDNYENDQGLKLVDLWLKEIDEFETTKSIILTEKSIIIGRDTREFGFNESSREYIEIEIPYYDITDVIRKDGILNKYIKE